MNININNMDQLVYIINTNEANDNQTQTQIHSSKGNQTLQSQFISMNISQPQTILTTSHLSHNNNNNQQQAFQLPFDIQSHQLNPQITEGVKKYNETMSMLEMKATEQHRQIAVEAHEQTLEIRRQRKQYHLEIENKKNMNLAQVYHQFDSWIKQMSKAANMVNNANKQFQILQQSQSTHSRNSQSSQSQQSQSQSSQPVTFVVSDIPLSQQMNNSNHNNNNNNNNQMIQGQGLRVNNVPPLSSPDPKAKTGFVKKEKR